MATLGFNHLMKPIKMVCACIITDTHIIVAAIHKLSKNRPAHCTLRVIKPAAAAFLKLTLFKGQPTFLKPFKIGAADVFAFLESL